MTAVTSIPIEAGAGARLLVDLLGRRRRRLAAVLVVAVASAITTAIVPALIERAVDAVEDSRRRDLMGTSVWLCTATIIGALINGVRLWQVTIIGQGVLHEIRCRATRSLGALPVGDFERIRRGDIVARVTSDVEQLESSVSEGIPFVVGALVSYVAAMVGLVLVSPLVAALALMVVPPMVASGRWLVSRSAAVYPQARATNGAMIAELAETLEGADEIRAFGRGRDRQRRFARVNNETSTANLVGMRMRIQFFSMLMFSQSSVLAVVLVVAATAAIDGRMSTGVVAAAMIGVSRVFAPLSELVHYADEIQSTRAALDRVAAIVAFDADAQVRVHTDPERLAPTERPFRQPADVVLDGVRFAYVVDRTIIHDLTLDLPAGSTTAIVGDTGAGKSTLARLITGLSKPDAGSVRVAGIDPARLPVDRRRRLVVSLLQEGFCVSGSIADNVRLADPDATDARVTAALEAAGCGWWRRFPAGIDSEVGHGGGALSNGERQLLALARVVVLDPEVVVLDEATSLLDPTAEAEVANALELAFAGRTVVIIAHRLATAARCPRVIRLEGGRIVADGAPADVLHAALFPPE